ncbi:hypothetical protein [Nostoc sp. TCL240-02]|nr:hypothetical protein [Nostoc sp. TCL240-02]
MLRSVGGVADRRYRQHITLYWMDLTQYCFGGVKHFQLGSGFEENVKE